MGSLGFRPPQFSEEMAWLPPHLQRVAGTSVEAGSPSLQQFKELSCIQGEDLELVLSREESQCNGFRLFLSGEDNSPISSYPSSKDVLHFRLHLSSDGDSPYCQSQLLSTFCARLGSDNAMQSPQVETLAGSGEKTVQIKTKNNAGKANALPPTSIPRAGENVGQQSSNDGKGGNQCAVEKFTVRNLKDTDTKDAVELSIAASEALVIHELVKSEPASEALPAAAVLEAALGVKQARLESSEDACDFPTQESDEIDFLTDLDDFTMADAFEDVGLSFRSLSDQHACGANVSLVKDTPVSENSFASENRNKNAEHVSLHTKHSNGLTCGIKNPGLVSNSDATMHKLTQDISHVSDTIQGVGFSVDASLQSQADLNFSELRNLEVAEGERNARPFVADGFRSRWFGGWTGQMEDDPIQLKPKRKGIPKCFAAETSFLSESADVAPDENSFILKCDNDISKIASDQSVLFEGVNDQIDEDIMASQDVRSSNLSLVDPLCSIVPCTISSEKDGSGEANAGFGSAAEPGNRNLHAQSVHGTEQALPAFSGESSVAKVQRQLTSLKIYSRVLHKNDSVLGSERLFLNQSTSLNLEPDMNSIRLSDKRNSETSLAARVIPECTGQDTNEKKQDTVVNNSDRGMMNCNQSSEKHVNDGAEFDQSSSQRSSPLILHRRMGQRLQATRPLVCGSPKQTNAEQTVAQETLVDFHSRSNLECIQSKCNNPFDMQVPSRKRVHLSETEVNFEQKEDLHKQQSLHRKCSAPRPSQRFKLDAQIQDSKRFSTSHFRDQKRFIFQDIQFLLTGFSRGKEKDLERLIRKYGGIIVVDIPSPSNRGKRYSRRKFQQLPIALCPKKWLTDSIAAGSALSPGKYMVLWDQRDARFTRIGKPVRHDSIAYIFDGVGFMLQGKQQFCTKFSKVIQYGGGLVFKTLLWLVQNLDNEKISLAVIVSENMSRMSRHLRQCASERKIPVMPRSWIVRSLYAGKLLPFVEKKDPPLHVVTIPDSPVSDDWSQEI